MKRIGLVVLVMLSIVSVMFAPTTYGHKEEPSTEDSSSIDARRQALKDALARREAILAAQKSRHCEIVKARLEFHRDKANEIRSHRANRYENILDRLNNLADRLDNNDIDTSELRAAIQSLTEAINQYSTAFNGLTTELQELISSVCAGDTQTSDDLARIRQIIVQLKSSADTVHTLVRNEIKPALENIKESVRQLRSEDTQDSEPQAESTN